MSGNIEHPVRRGFLAVDSRQVHYRTAGSGPPALFVHSSPTNGTFVLEDLLAQADRHTGVAFDTPGFGLSDHLPGTPTVADLADATAAAMAAFGLPPVPVYGTHTGAAIALELAVRHPGRVTGVVLDGVPAFTPEEYGEPLRDYYFTLRPDPLGGHFAAVWTRFRDQSIWYPWCDPRPENLQTHPAYDAASVHRWCAMFYDAAEHYAPAFRSAVEYGDGALAAATALTVPAVFTARAGDMMFPHLARLPRLRPGQEIRPRGPEREARLPLTREAFARFAEGGPRSPGVTPATPTGLTAGPGVRRQVVDDGGRALAVRYAGDPAGPATVLLHDLPGSSEGLEPGEGFVLAPDLPGSGESDPLPEGAPLAAYAAALWRACDALGIERPVVQGIGFGASVAVEMAAQRPVAGLTLTGLLLPDGGERAELLSRYAPPLELRADGGHWYALWSQLRDSLIFWPWYDTRPQAQRRVPVDLGGERLHRWTVEVMKQREAYHRSLHAVLRHDAQARLREVTAPVTIEHDPLVPVSAAYGARLDDILERV